ncbi:MAG: peptidoglycan endopeptidase [Clostridia bacterium]
MIQLSLDIHTLTTQLRPVLSLCLAVCLAAVPVKAGAEPFDTAAAFATFADPADLWGSGVESVMEQAYRDCFRTYILGGKVITLRMPFAQNNEREEMLEEDLAIEGGGKADPLLLWDQIDSLLDTEDFRAYTAVLGDGTEKVVIFDLQSRSWSLSRDLFDIARMKAGAYRGLPHKPYVYTTGKGIEATDIYNYLYCIGRLGMDCSGFVWHILSATAKAGGLDLGRTLSRALRAPRGADPALYAGTSFFDSRSTELIQVKDQLRNLLPGDVILFRGADGTAVHSAVIQSIDLEAGTIRYLQSTDEAPLAERGVHDSYIRFDPARPELSLKDPSLQWTQKRFPAFPGERPSAFSEDGERYRAYPEFGAGKVVRLKAMAAPIKRINARAGR